MVIGLPRTLPIVSVRPVSGSSDAESNNGVRLDQTALDIEPDFAALDFVIVRPFVQAALAAFHA